MYGPTFHRPCSPPHPLTVASLKGPWSGDALEFIQQQRPLASNHHNVDAERALPSPDSDQPTPSRLLFSPSTMLGNPLSGTCISLAQPQSYSLQHIKEAPGFTLFSCMNWQHLLFFFFLPRFCNFWLLTCVPLGWASAITAEQCVCASHCQMCSPLRTSPSTTYLTDSHRSLSLWLKLGRGVWNTVLSLNYAHWIVL